MCPVGFRLLDRTHIYFDIFRLTAQAFGLTARCGGSHLKPGLVRTTASRLSKLRLIASVTSETQDMQKPAAVCRPFLRSENSSQRNRLFFCSPSVKPRSLRDKPSGILGFTSGSPHPHHRPSVQYLNYFTKPITRHTWLNTKIPMKK